jgi:putative ubiquitin-RnfH superfamily antitoxin RatB of RatAB toxin-antitoxin module
MNEELLKKISNQLTILIRLEVLKEEQEKMKISELLDLVKDMDLTDNEVGIMFNVSAQALRNTRSKRNRIEK